MSLGRVRSGRVRSGRVRSGRVRVVTLLLARLRLPVPALALVVAAGVPWLACERALLPHRPRASLTRAKARVAEKATRPAHQQQPEGDCSAQRRRSAAVCVSFRVQLVGPSSRRPVATHRPEVGWALRLRKEMLPLRRETAV